MLEIVLQIFNVEFSSVLSLILCHAIGFHHWSFSLWFKHHTVVIVEVPLLSHHANIDIDTVEQNGRAQKRDDRRFLFPPLRFPFNFRLPFAETKSKCLTRIRAISFSNRTVTFHSQQLKLIVREFRERRIH